MQWDGQANDLPGLVANGGPLHGCSKPPEMNRTKYPLVVYIVLRV